MIHGCRHRDFAQEATDPFVAVARLGQDLALRFNVGATYPVVVTRCGQAGMRNAVGMAMSRWYHTGIIERWHSPSGLTISLKKL